jgi:hypothetical protein
VSRRNYTNNAPITTLIANVTASDAAINVASLAGFPGSYPYTVVIDADTAAAEVVLVTSASGTVAAVTRGFDGTSAVSHLNGATFGHVGTAIDFNEANAHVNATSGVHGVASTLVGTTDTQTLTNKTLTSPTVNTPTESSPTVIPNGSSDVVNFKNGANTLMKIANDGSILLDPIASAANPLLAHRQRASGMTQDFIQFQDASAAVLGKIDHLGEGVLAALQLTNYATPAAAATALGTPVVGQLAMVGGKLCRWDSSGTGYWVTVTPDGGRTPTLTTSASGRVTVTHTLTYKPLFVFAQLFSGNNYRIEFIASTDDTHFDLQLINCADGSNAASGQSVVIDWRGYR